MSVSGYYRQPNKPDKLIKCIDYEISNGEKINNQEQIAFTIKENTNCELYFVGNPNARVYIDNARTENGKNGYLQLDTDGLFFNPNTINTEKNKYNMYYIYHNYNNDNIIDGYGPGIFRIKIVEVGESTKYAYFQIEPKFIDNIELDIMRKDVENTVFGMARSFEAINNGMLLSDSTIRGRDLLDKISFLHEKRKQFKRSVFKIKNDPRITIDKIYRWSHQFNNTDDYTNRISVTRPNYANSQFSFKRQVSTNIHDNQVIKYELNAVKRVIIKAQKQISLIRKSRVGENAVSLQKDEEILKEYVVAIEDINNSNSFINVDAKNGKLSYSAMMNSDYLFLSKIYSKLVVKKKDSKYFIRQYVYEWIATQDLYEIWGFITTVKQLIKLGFQPISGWIFDNDFNTQYILKHGTSVKFELKKDNNVMRVQVKYNISLKRNPDGQLLWTTEDHNKPDIMIIVQSSEDEVLSVMVLDTKYRDIGRVYSDKREQLQDYKTGISATKVNPVLKALDLRIVSGVAVLYPRKGEIGTLPSFAEALNIVPIEVRPNEGNDRLRDFIVEGINTGITRFDSIPANENKISTFRV